LDGVVKDQTGNPVSNVRVSIQNGNAPEVITDQQGVFVFAELPIGDHILVIKPPSDRGQLLQHIQTTNRVNQVTVVYNAQNSRLGLLSIVAPVDDGIVELRRDGTEFRAMIYGRCDGMADILEQFDIWILIRSQRDQLFWVQHPPAVVDPSSSSWRADVLFGNSETPPSDGEKWHVVVVAAHPNSLVRRVLNTEYLNELPPHINGNVITIETKIKP
jgi:hypothetical protein